jgi:hypothetical protein
MSIKCLFHFEVFPKANWGRFVYLAGERLRKILRGALLLLLNYHRAVNFDFTLAYNDMP